MSIQSAIKSVRRVATLRSGCARAAPSARRDLGRAWRQFRAVLRARDQGRALPVRPGRRAELERIELPEYTDEVWHGYLPGARPGTVYGYRVHGPYEPDAGHRFNPEQAADRPLRQAARRSARPGARSCSATSSTPPTRTCPSTSATAPPSCRNAGSSIRPSPGDASGRPSVPWERTIIYEMHVQGLHHAPSARIPRRAARHLRRPRRTRSVIAYLRSLGVTSAELLPIHAFVDDSYLVEKGLRNYWGYNSIGFFAPDPRYLHSPFVNEFKEMVNQFHAAGIEVILDVVYNHTAEGNELGPTLSLQGHRQRQLLPAAAGPEALLHQRHRHREHGQLSAIRACCRWSPTACATGRRRCGSTASASISRPSSRASPTASTRAAASSIPAGRIRCCRQVKLIAEPWDIGPGGYQVGHFPPGWAEWNDKFRDTVRAYWKGDEGKLAELASAADRLRRSVQPARPQALGERQFHHRA